MVNERAVVLLHDEIGHAFFQRDVIGVVVLELEREQGAELCERVGRGAVSAWGHADGAGFAIGEQFFYAGFEFGIALL